MILLFLILIWLSAVKTIAEPSPSPSPFSFSNIVPTPNLPLNPDDPATIAQTKAWMIQKFGVPPDATIINFFVGTDNACLIWDTFHEGEKTGHWSHIRSYKFPSQSVIVWNDVDLGKLGL
jgi:hypothetical protein